MKRVIKQGIALITTLAFVVVSAPVSASAPSVSDTSATTTAGPNTESPVTEPQILTEEESKREEQTKHFLLSDGRYLAVQYEQPVHYRDADGVWQDYDNRLVDDTSESDTVKNKNSDVTVKLSKKAKENKMIRLRSGEYELSWGYAGTNKSDLRVIEKTSTATGNRAWTDLMNMSSSVVYENIYSGVDLQVILSGGTIKENLILNTADAVGTFTINYNIDKLTPQQVDDRTIVLKDADGAVVYTLSAPVMTDSNDQSSTNLSLRMTQKNKKLTVEIVPDTAWLTDAEREYPVTIDPFVLTQQKNSAIESASLFSNSTTSYPYGSLLAGRSSAYGYMAGVIKTDMPTLAPGDVVVNAQLRLRQISYYGTVQVNASRITSEWTQAQYVPNTGTIPAAYNSRPSRDSKIEDFNIASASTNGTFAYWDITTVVQNWYKTNDNDNANYGIMLWSHTPDTYAYASYKRQSNVDAELSEYFPVFEIMYVNNNGLEDYWPYDSATVTQRGTMSVNLHSGNLVVTENIFSTTGNRMPMSISLVYNSNNYNQKFPYGASAGYGFMFNFQQRVDDITDPLLLQLGYKYIYTDGDGTKHYFRQKVDDGGNIVADEWTDESGLGMTLKETGDSGIGIYIYLKDGTLLHFNTPANSGVLYFIRDTYGNKIRYYGSYLFGSSYGMIVTTIQDGAGRRANISYELVSGVVRPTKITDNENREYLFTYSSTNPNLLTGISYPDGTSTTYNYDIYNALLGITDSLSQQYTHMEYIHHSHSVQVDGYTQWIQQDDNTELLTDLYTYVYMDDSTTKVLDAESRMTVYQFDGYGRVASIRYDDGSIANMNYTANFTAEGSAASSDTQKNNKLESHSASEKYVKNYVVNSNAERNSSFYCSFWDNNTIVTQSYDSTTAYLGQRSIKVCHDQEGMTFSSYAQQIFTTELADSDVTFSAYIKTSNVTSAAGNGAGLTLLHYNAEGTCTGTVYSPYYLTGTNDWTRVSLTAHLPAGTAEVRVYCSMRDASGTAWYDCLQLEKGNTVSDYNAVENSDFSSTDRWTAKNFATGDTLSGNGKVTITGDAITNTNKYVYQTIDVYKPSDEVCFNFFGTIEGPQAAEREGRLCALEANIIYTDGTSEYHAKNFNAAVTEEQSISFVVKPEESDKTVKTIGVFYIVRKNANTTNLLNMMLTVDETGSSYEYDNDGNLLSATDNANRNQEYYYTEADELDSYTNIQGENYDYIYNTTNAHQLDAVRSEQLGNGFTYAYDSYGNVTTVNMGIVSSTGVLDTTQESIQASGTYTSNGNYPATVTDARGNTSTYDINSANGLLNSVTVPVTDSNVNTTLTNSYTYDATSRLLTGITISNSALTRSIGYTYDSQRRLTDIVAGTTKHSFTYDAYGNVVNVKTGSTMRVQDLITHQYADARKGLIGQSTYANGATVSYAYDEYDRLIQKSAGNTLLLTNAYNNRGLLARVTENAAGFSTEYSYDLIGRLSQSHTYGSRAMTMDYTYDTMDRLKSMKATADGLSRSTTYYYGSDNRLTGLQLGSIRYEYTYDHLNRLSSESAIMLSGDRLVSQYSYITGTTLVSEKRLYRNNTLLETMSYTYDKSGNIASIRKDGAVQVMYAYDSLGQLVREDNVVTDKTIVYAYLANGNLYTTTEYPLMQTDTATKVDVRQYAFSNWQTLATSYNTESFSLDAMGNPLTYRDGMTMTWQRGRQLATLQKSGNVVQYTYDSSGLRLSKTINDATTNYYYDDAGQLIRAKNGTNDIWFYYGIDGTAQTFMVNGTGYCYLKNLQGDVVALTDFGGAIVARYTYDAWGKLLTVTDANGNDVSNNATHIANINPLRYRSYYYDTESGFYYLTSRYYDPTVGRFISADGYASTGQGYLGHNMFAYCNNNPVNYVDSEGTNAEACQQLLGTWSAGMWWLCGVDTVLPFGDVVYGVGILVILVVATCYYASDNTGDATISWDTSASLSAQNSLTPNDDDDPDDPYEDWDDDSPKTERIGRSKGNAPRSNQIQNRQAKDIRRRTKLQNDRRRQLHDLIHDQGYSYQEALEMAEEFVKTLH